MQLSQFCGSNLLHTQECLERYTPGGYHPVSLGDLFHAGRYKVSHKLGWGGFSTVWLAFDRDQKRWVSLKILTANSDMSQELSTFQYLDGKSSGGLAGNYIVQLLDSFVHEGPNGTHQCLVFELLGPSVDHVLQDYKDGQDQLEPEDILRISQQLLKAVRFIHSSGMCHGDISGRNIAFTCTKLENTTEEELFEVIGAPEIEPLVRRDGLPLEESLPTQLIEAVKWTNWIDEDEEDIRLLDFGESFLQGEEPQELAQPGQLRAPETILTDTFDYRIDLWRVGVMIYLFLFTAYPFWYFGEQDTLIYQMIGFVEALPTEWLSRWKELRKSSERSDLEVEDYESSRLEKEFAEKIHDPALAALLPIMQGLMRFLPSDRISVEQALGMLAS